MQTNAPRPEPGFDAHVSRAVDAPPEAVFHALTNAPLRATWLPGAPALDEGAMDPPTGALFTWGAPGKAHGSRVLFTLEPTDGATRVHVRHAALDSREGADILHAYWARALDHLAQHVRRR